MKLLQSAIYVIFTALNIVLSNIWYSYVNVVTFFIDISYEWFTNIIIPTYFQFIHY